MHSTGQHNTSWWSDQRAFHRSTQYLMVVRSPCTPPVNTVPHGGQTTVHSTSQYSTTWWSDHRAFHQSTQCLMVVRSACIPPVNTVPHGGQNTVLSTSQYTTLCLVFPHTRHVRFCSVQHSVYALEEARMYSTTSLRSLSSAALI